MVNSGVGEKKKRQSRPWGSKAEGFLGVGDVAVLFEDMQICRSSDNTATSPTPSEKYPPSNSKKTYSVFEIVGLRREKLCRAFFLVNLRNLGGF